MDISVAGFKETGDWEDIVEHGKRISRVLREEDAVPDAAFEEWEEWRPKTDESLTEEVTEKTADQASIGEGEGEKEGKAPADDLKEAGKKATESTANLKDAGKQAPQSPDEAAGRMSEAGEDLQQSAGYFARAVDSISRKLLRKTENIVYTHVMTRLSPYYFDNDLISANVQQKTDRFGDDTTFVFEVNINDDELKRTVEAELVDEQTDEESADS